MMIHTLPTTVKDATHARITRIVDHPASSIEIHYRLGTTDAGKFVPDPLIPELRKVLKVDTADTVRARAEDAGAPTTAGAQEYRVADVLAAVDADEGWGRR